MPTGACTVTDRSRPARKRLLALIGSTVAIGVLSAPAAEADTYTSLRACQQGWPAATHQLHLDPQSLGVHSGLPGDPLQLQIQPGGVVRVTATGRISYGGIFNWRGTWGPDGNGGLAGSDPLFPWPGGPDAALIGKWNQTMQNVRIGSDSGCLVVPSRTISQAPYGLWLKANDSWIHDNGDIGYDITVRAWRYVP